MDSNVRQFMATSVRATRRQQGISQQQFADMAGLSRITVQRIEQGTANPTLSVMLKVSNALDTALADLIAPDTCKQTAHSGEAQGALTC